MSEPRFDRLTKLFATTGSRRALLGAALAAVASGGVREAAAATRPPGRLCREDANCASGSCGPKDRSGRRRCLCGSPADCPTARSCRRATCDAGVCHEVDDDGAACKATPCTEVGACQQGRCVELAAIDCGALDSPCTVGVCNLRGGVCEVQNVAEGAACVGADRCADAVCQAGSCVAVGPKDCGALATECADGTCDAATGACVATPKNEGQFCDASGPCTTGTCQGGACVGSTPVDCSSLNSECKRGACDPATNACFAEPDPAKIGQTCDDGDVCTTGSTCQANGSCGGGQAVSCTTPPECQQLPGICDEFYNGCAYAAKPDGQLCNGGAGRCGGGQCISCLADGQRICPREGVIYCCTPVCYDDPLNPGACCICGNP